MTEENTTEETDKGGRPSVFREAYIDQAYKLCLLKATDADLADFFGVCESTLNNWKNDVPEFKEALKRGKDQADAEVAEKLFNRAMGYEHDEEKVFLHEGEPVTVKITKVVPPDVTAQKYWLNNRQRQNWKDRQDVELSGELAHDVKGVPEGLRILERFIGGGEDKPAPDAMQD